MKFRYLGNPSAAFRISGPDANTFLGGQFTQELKISFGRVAYGLWLSQKGKVVAESEVARFSAEEHLVVSTTCGADLLRRRLEDYLIADEVDIQDQRLAWEAFSLWGEGAAERVAAWFPGVGKDGTFGRKDEALLLPERGGGFGRFLLLAPSGGAETWRARLAEAGAREATEAEEARDRILAGLPAVPADIGPDDLPNEGGLETIAISYTKGCYLGQEVMSRLKNLGQVRRRLLRVRGAGPAPAPRTALFQGETRVGETRTAAADGDGWVGFALVSLVLHRPGQPTTLGAGGSAVEVEAHG